MGRPQFAAAGTGGGGQTIATTSRPEVKDIVSDQTGDVASGATETVEVYAPTGSVYKVIAFRVSTDPVSNATTNPHRFNINVINGAVGVIKGESAYSSPLTYKHGIWQDADSEQLPSTEAAQERASNHMWATENSPVQFIYDNSTDAAQSSDRVYRTVVREDSY